MHPPTAFRIRFKNPQPSSKALHDLVSGSSWPISLTGRSTTLLANSVILRSQINCLIHRESFSSWTRLCALLLFYLHSTLYCFLGLILPLSLFICLMPVILLLPPSPIHSEHHEYCNLVYFAYSCNSSREHNSSIQQAFSR